MNLLQLGILIFSVLADILVGIFVVSKNKRSYTNWFFFIFTTVSALLSIVNTSSLNQPTEALTLVYARLAIFLATIYCASLFLTIHTFPKPQLRLKKIKFVFLLGVVFLLLILTQTSLIFSNVHGTGQDSSPMVGPGIGFFALVNGCLIISSIYIVVRRYFESSGSIKSQLQYLMVGVCVSSLFIFLTGFILVIILKSTSFITLIPIFSLFFILFTAYAIIAHHLFDIRIIIRKTLVYSTLLLTTLGTYSMIVFLITSFFGNDTTTLNTKSFFSNFLAAVLISMGFDPLRRLLEDRTDRYFFKKAYDQEDVLKNLSHNLKDIVALDSALEIVMKTIVRVLHLDHAATFVFQMGEEKKIGIKHIKQIGYGSTAHLVLGDHDFVIPYFTSNSKITLVEDFEHHIIQQNNQLDKIAKRKTGPLPENVSSLIRENAIAKSVLKKLKALDVAVVIPLDINRQPIGLLMLSAKLSGDPFFPEDLTLLETIGAQTISSIEKAKLYEGDRMKSEFVSIASHELLTPVSAIEGYLSMILDENIGKVDPQARDYLTKVYISAKRLSQLVKDILSVSRIEAGRLKIELQALDIAKIITDTLDQLKFVAAEKGLLLEKELPSTPLPPAWADPDRLMQVMINLVGNSIKYTPSGSVTVSAKLIHNPQPLIRVTISDTGIGMDKSQQTHLFEKFYRAESDGTTGIAGTGLGLYITKSLLENMNGTITVKSQEGKGSSFIFTLPLFQVENSQAE